VSRLSRSVAPRLIRDVLASGRSTTFESVADGSGPTVDVTFPVAREPKESS
jgi:hypothetical protein